MIETADGSTGREVVVVNQRFVERFLGNGDPIGRRVMLRPDEKDTVWSTGPLTRFSNSTNGSTIIRSRSPRPSRSPIWSALAVRMS